jgi:hypothetical protein
MTPGFISWQICEYTQNRLNQNVKKRFHKQQQALPFLIDHYTDKIHNTQEKK